MQKLRMDHLIQSLAHIAFEVKKNDEELAKRDINVIMLPNAPTDGVRAAMIEFDKYK